LPNTKRLTPTPTLPRPRGRGRETAGEGHAGAWSRGPSGDATVQARISTRGSGALHPAPGSHPSAKADGTCSALRGRGGGQPLRYALFTSALGPMGIAWGQGRVVAVQLPEEDRDATLARLRTRLPRGGLATSLKGAPAWLRRAVSAIQRHLDGDPQDLSSIPLDFDGIADFRRRVYEAARRCPSGRTVSYAELARLAGSPRAFRAVGSAMSKNPVPMLVPCHRVVGSGGKSGGFSAYGGVATKARLLALEAAGGRDAASDPHAEAVGVIAAADPTLAALMARVGACRLARRTAETPFETLLESIVHQQLTGKAAATILARVKALFPRGLPTPAKLAALSDERLRGAGLSGSKTASLKDLAARALKGEIPDLATLERLDDEAIVERLTVVRGVGRWTVEMLLIFRLGRLDVLPATDYGVRKGFALTFRGGPSRRRAKATEDPALPSPADLLAHGERWRPYRSIASWYLWRSLDQP
jgi:O-6-methylguanine DNA methyltransferase